MKKSALIILFFLLLPIALAEDISITLNGKDPAEGIKLEPGQAYNLKIKIAPGIYIKDIQASSNNNFVKKIIQMQNLREGLGTKTKSQKIVEHSIQLPSLLPAGTFTAKLDISYEKEGEEKKMSQALAFSVPPHGILSRVLGFASKTFSVDILNEVVNYFIPQPLERIAPGLTVEDVIKLGPHKIDLSVDEARNERFNVEILHSRKEGLSMTPELFDLVASKASKDSTKQEILDIKEAHHPKITKTLTVAEIVNPLRETKMIASKVVLSIDAKGGVNDLQIIEFIPKNIANDSENIKFLEAPAILEKDPILRWDYGSVPADRYQYTGYLIEKDVGNYSSLTVAGGRKPPFTAKLMRFFLFGGWIAIAFIFVGVITYILYSIYRLLFR